MRVIEGRIDDLQPIEPSNGYYFNVSEKQNETVILEPEIESIIKEFRQLSVNKVAPCHCSGDETRRMFREEYGEDYIDSGAGKIITWP